MHKLFSIANFRDNISENFAKYRVISPKTIILYSKQFCEHFVFGEVFKCSFAASPVSTPATKSACGTDHFFADINNGFWYSPRSLSARIFNSVWRGVKYFTISKKTILIFQL